VERGSLISKKIMSRGEVLLKTLVFCTSYAETESSWEDRQAIWLKAMQRSSLHFDQLLIVDDGSAVLPQWSGLTVVHEADAPAPEKVQTTDPLLLYAHTERLGRQSVFQFPGWYRSFAFGVLYGAAHGFDKIIHLESDAFLISERIQRHFNEFTTGWFSVWSEAYIFPEIAIQAAAGSAIAEMADFVRKPYSQLSGQIHEFLFPFTHLERTFVGNRYGEMIGHVPRQADYSAQTRVGQPDAFYWWIPQTASPAIHRREVVRLRAPFPADILEGSWSAPEADMSWMLDLDSSLFLPPVAKPVEHDMELNLLPCLYQERKQQRLHVLINDRLVNSVTLYRGAKILCHIPPGTLITERLNHVRFLHPDAFRPNEVGPHPEQRRLSIALKECVLFERLDR